MPGPIVAQRCVGQSRWPPFICRLIRLNFILWNVGLRACAGPYLTESFETRAALETALSDVLQAFRNAPDRLARLTGFGWWLQALET